ncbi:MAG: cytochrome c [Terracidiphilus sp.]
MNLRSSHFLLPAWLLLGLLLASFPAHAASKSEANPRAGALLFRDKGCAYCHGSGGVGTKKAPSLLKIREDKAWPAEKITEQILDGGDKMPPFRDSLSDEEIARIVAYLRARHRPVPPPLPDGATPAPPATAGAGP